MARGEDQAKWVARYIHLEWRLMRQWGNEAMGQYKRLSQLSGGSG
jgi:hypothetical protein